MVNRLVHGNPADPGFKSFGFVLRESTIDLNERFLGHVLGIGMIFHNGIHELEYIGLVRFDQCTESLLVAGQDSFDKNVIFDRLSLPPI